MENQMKSSGWVDFLYQKHKCVNSVSKDASSLVKNGRVRSLKLTSNYLREDGSFTMMSFGR